MQQLPTQDHDRDPHGTMRTANKIDSKMWTQQGMVTFALPKVSVLSFCF